MFHSWSNLGSNVHIVKSKIKAAYNVCLELMKRLESDIAALAINNAAKAVAKETAKDLKRVLQLIFSHFAVSRIVEVCANLFPAKNNTLCHLQLISKRSTPLPRLAVEVDCQVQLCGGGVGGHQGHR